MAILIKKKKKISYSMCIDNSTLCSYRNKILQFAAIWIKQKIIMYKKQSKLKRGEKLDDLIHLWFMEKMKQE